MNKSKLIKKYVGDEIKREGFAYVGFSGGTWNFSRREGNIKQEIIIIQHRFFSNQVKLVFNTGVYGWGDQELRNFIPQYKNHEFWNYESEEDYIEILRLFSKIIFEYGLDILEKMSKPRNSIYPTPELNKYLYEYYMNNCENIDRLFYDRDCKIEIEEISRILFEYKNEDFINLQELLIKLAARYTRAIQNVLGGELILEDNKCILKKIGNKQGLILPLSLIITRWKQYHEKIDVDYDILLAQYQQLLQYYT